jgi:uncharacterized protein YcnI
MMGGPTRRRTAVHRPPAAHAPRAVGVAVVALLCLLLLPGIAAADVTVAASRAEAGARDVTITFRVTDDDPAAPVTRLQVFLPTARPLLGVVPTAPSGWTVRVDEAPPEAPLTVDGTPVTVIATAVTWEGGRLAGPGYGVFPIDVSRLPDGAGPLRFRVVQTDARGGVVEWSDLVTYGAPPPAHPALLVPYTTPGVPAATASPVDPGHHHHGDAGNLALPAAAGSGGSAGRTVAVAALVALVVAVWASALGRRQRRRMAALRPPDRTSEP